ADLPEVRELVGVDDPADAGDLAAGDAERADANQPLLSVEHKRSRVPVDLDEPVRHVRNARDPADPADDRARDTAAPAQRPRERGSLAAPVTGERRVMREHGFEPSEIALLGGLEEPSRQLVALLARRLEAWAALLDVTPGAGGELADVVLALADDPRDLR